MREQPNVLVFVTDQHRYDYLGCLGRRNVETPNLDAIARDGVVFSNAYAVNTVCQPTRTTMMTGQTLRGHGRRTPVVPQNPNLVTLPELLGDRGYRTHAVGKLHLHSWLCSPDQKKDELHPSDWPELRHFWETGQRTHLPEPYYGFQTTEFVGAHTHGVYGDYRNWIEREHPEALPYLKARHPENVERGSQTRDWALPEALHYNRWISDKTGEFLEENAGTDQPFFLWCSFPDPHPSFTAPKPWSDMYHPGEMQLGPQREGELGEMPPFYQRAYDNDPEAILNLIGLGRLPDEQTRIQMAMYSGMVSFVDHEIGRVMAKLEELGLSEDTIVVFISDHGDMMGDHGLTRKGPFQYRGAIQIPFIVSWKGRFQNSGRISDALTGQLDLVPTVLDLCGVEPCRQHQFALSSGKGDMPPPVLPGKSLRPILTGERDRVNDFVIHENDMDHLGLRIRTFVTDRYRLTVYPGETYGELFDLREDPDELHNLWDRVDKQAIRQELIHRFLEAYILQDIATPNHSHTEKVIGYPYSPHDAEASPAVRR